MTTLPNSSLQCVDIDAFRIVQIYLTKTNSVFHTFLYLKKGNSKSLSRAFKSTFLKQKSPRNSPQKAMTSKPYVNSQILPGSFPFTWAPFHPTLKVNLFLMRLNLSITFLFRFSKLVQYFACQRFGHFSLYCGYASRCVKNVGPHLVIDCIKPRDVIPKCVNCNGDHTANYDKCLSILLETGNRHPVRPNTAKPLSNLAFSHLSNKFTPISNQPSLSSSHPSKPLPLP